MDAYRSSASFYPLFTRHSTRSICSRHLFHFFSPLTFSAANLFPFYFRPHRLLSSVARYVKWINTKNNFFLKREGVSCIALFLLGGGYIVYECWQLWKKAPEIAPLNKSKAARTERDRDGPCYTNNNKKQTEILSFPTEILSGGREPTPFLLSNKSNSGNVG